MTKIEQDRHRIDALHQAIREGAQLSHRAVEIVAVQDAARYVHEPELQLVGRGIEVLGKATWILNKRLMTGSFHPANKFRHRLVELLEAIDVQAAARSQPRVLGDPVVAIIAATAATFAEGGRFGHLDGLASGRHFSPPYLAWNELQMQTSELAKKRMDQEERTAYLRAAHTRALQGLERSLAEHLRSAQLDLWGDVIVCRAWLDATAQREDAALSEPIALEVRDWRCECSSLDRGIWIWTPVESRDGARRGESAAGHRSEPRQGLRGVGGSPV